jgi:hypothetical protein
MVVRVERPEETARLDVNCNPLTHREAIIEGMRLAAMHWNTPMDHRTEHIWQGNPETIVATCS